MLKPIWPYFFVPGFRGKQSVRLAIVASWAAIAYYFVGQIPSAFCADVPPDYRYQIQVLATGLSQPLLLQLAPDGRIFFNELAGKLRIRKPSGELVDAGMIPVFAEQENGFLGFALDPQFERNQWIYLLYSPTNFVGQRLSRFRMDGDHLDLTSEKEVLNFPEQRRECCHHAGSVRFAPDGCLLISTGDNTNPFGDSESYGPMDERPGREPWDAQRTAANTQSKNGKILRIRPTPEGGYTIPDGNLFPKDGSEGCPEIFVMGCRNPWRMAIDENTGFVYWGEVGPDANDDGPRGSRGYDEINQARKAGNYGWPYFVGNNFPYAKFDYATKTVGPLFDPARPINNSVNNTGAKVLPPAQPAMIYWPYGSSKEFPMLGSGGRTACAGPVFHFQAGFEKTGGFPEQFDNCLLFWDWQRPFIRWARLDADSHLLGIEPFTGAVTLANERSSIDSAEKAGAFVIRRPADARFGPDGCLYLLDYGETWGVNPDAKLIKISFERGNLPPVAKAAATPAAGREPLTVTLSSQGSKDYEGSPLQFEWRLFESIVTSASNSSLRAVGRLISTEANPRVTIDKPGNYVVQLTVADDQGSKSSTSLPLVIGNTAPEVNFEIPNAGARFTPGQPIAYRVHVRDAEDGDSAQYEELMDSRVFVMAHWTRDDGKEEASHPGLNLMRQSDCFNCHSIQTKIVGPAYLDVANKYRDTPGALEASVQRVIKGSTGVWGNAPMLPHESFTTDQVHLMVQWVLSLKPGQSGDGLVRGLAGKILAPIDQHVTSATLEAVYTDFGRAPVGSLVGKAQLTLARSNSKAAAAAPAPEKIRVLVWDERQPDQKRAYENFLGNAIAEHLSKRAEFEVKSVSLADPEQGLGRDVLEQTDVLVWWGHQKQREVSWETGDRIVERIKAGKLALIALHSAHWSTPFIKAMNARTLQDALNSLTEQERGEYKISTILPPAYQAPTRDARITPFWTKKQGADGSKVLEVYLPLCVFPAYRADGKPGHITTLLRDHPIAAGLPEHWDVAQTEMYDEPFHVPGPDQVIFEERWDAGEHFRSGCVWSVGKGKVFYFRPGHEIYPVYKQAMPLKVIENAVAWLGEEVKHNR
jgi:cytochrome c